MADTVTTRYIFPPNWDGFYPDSRKPEKRYIVNFSCISDGTGETDVIKLALGDFLTPSGYAAERFVIENVAVAGYGFAYITLEFDRAPHQLACLISDTANFDFGDNGIVDDGIDGTGNLILTTSGATAGDSYSITVTFRVK